MTAWSGHFAQMMTAAVLDRDGYRCQMPRDPYGGGRVCGRVATTADHIVPRALGGSHAMSNLRAACERCNKSAGGKLGALLRHKRRAVVRHYPGVRL